MAAADTTLLMPIGSLLMGEVDEWHSRASARS